MPTAKKARRTAQDLATLEDCIRAVGRLAQFAFPKWASRDWKVGLAPFTAHFSQCDAGRRELAVAHGVPRGMVEVLFAHQLVHALGIEGHGARFRQRLARAAKHAEGQAGGARLARRLRKHVALYEYLAVVMPRMKLLTGLLKETMKAMPPAVIGKRAASAPAPKDPITLADARAAFERVRAAAFPRWRATGWRVRVGAMENIAGYCQPARHIIAIARSAPRESLDRTMAHEIAHAVSDVQHGSTFCRELLRAAARARTRGHVRLSAELLEEVKEVRMLEEVRISFREIAAEHHRLLESAEAIMGVCKEPTDAPPPQPPRAPRRTLARRRPASSRG